MTCGYDATGNRSNLPHNGITTSIGGTATLVPEVSEEIAPPTSNGATPGMRKRNLQRAPFSLGRESGA
jgi:hypothetical protein